MNRKRERDSSMMTAPRDRKLLLERYGSPSKFVGRWDHETQRWLNEAGEWMTKVHTWHPLPSK
jgi:hypothetical protein